jgi:hypothetical protein
MARLGQEGIRYDELVQHVERSLNLPAHLYANDPELRGPALEETRRALRSVLAYFLYRDLNAGGASRRTKERHRCQQDNNENARWFHGLISPLTGSDQLGQDGKHLPNAISNMHVDV